MTEMKEIVLVALMRFKNAVHLATGEEKEKVATAKLLYPSKVCLQCRAENMKLLRHEKTRKHKRKRNCDAGCLASDLEEHKKDCKRTQIQHANGDHSKDKILVAEFLSSMILGGGAEGVLSTVLRFV